MAALDMVLLRFRERQFLVFFLVSFVLGMALEPTMSCVHYGVTLHSTLFFLTAFFFSPSQL